MGHGPNPPNPNPQSPIPNPQMKIDYIILNFKLKELIILN
jgi:hypothetical protein